MHRFYCPNLPATPPSGGDLSDNAPPAVARLDPDESHHARRVLRLDVGAVIELFDGKGRTARGAIEGWSGGAAVKLSEVRVTPPLRPALDLAVAIPKGPRADEMVNQLSQLGVDRLIPLGTERSVVDPRPQKLEKFSRAAVESAKQCGRAWLMSVEAQVSFDAALAMPHDVKLIASPGAAAGDDRLARVRAAQRVLVLIGPEGGWTEGELLAAREAGCVAWSLGPNILRIETAAVAAAAIVRGM